MVKIERVEKQVVKRIDFTGIEEKLEALVSCMEQQNFLLTEILKTLTLLLREERKPKIERYEEARVVIERLIEKKGLARTRDVVREAKVSYPTAVKYLRKYADENGLRIVENRGSSGVLIVDEKRRR